MQQFFINTQKEPDKKLYQRSHNQLGTLGGVQTDTETSSSAVVASHAGPHLNLPSQMAQMNCPTRTLSWNTSKG